MKSNSLAAEMVRHVVEAHAEGIDAGYALQQKKLDTIAAAYDKALQDPSVKIPTYLHAAIEASKSGQQPQKATVETRSGVGATEYLVTGELPAVFQAIEEIFRDKHPLGYGTRVAAIDAVLDGVFAARITRSNSCD
jgi:hypothetical protein